MSDRCYLKKGEGQKVSIRLVGGREGGDSLHDPRPMLCGPEGTRGDPRSAEERAPRPAKPTFNDFTATVQVSESTGQGHRKTVATKALLISDLNVSHEVNSVLQPANFKTRNKS